MQTAFTVLICAQFLVILLHDLVEIPGWSHTSQMRAVLGRRKLYAATAANAVLPGIAMVFAIIFWHRAPPHYATRYWLIYCAVTVLSALGMWYVPYFLGASEQKKDEYARFYAGTRHALPARGDNPRPNLLHMLFHVLFAATLIVAVVVAVS